MKGAVEAAPAAERDMDVEEHDLFADEEKGGLHWGREAEKQAGKGTLPFSVSIWRLCKYLWVLPCQGILYTLDIGTLIV